MIKCLYVGLGGFVGASLRYLFMLLPISAGSFPISTLMINFIGAVLIGILTEVTGEIPPITSNGLLFMEIGVCGGFTAFSAFGLETVLLIQDGKNVTAYIYIGLSIALCIIGVIIGETLVKSFKG